MNNDLKIIKKKYGEDMMHLCRRLFPTILEKPGLLPEILLAHFEEDKCLCKNILEQDLELDFQNYILSIAFPKEEITQEDEVTKTPKELLDEAGYDLYECHSEEEIQAFKKYYAPGEELCTFRGGRLNRCHVFFAVKKDVDNIKRRDFKTPNRQDLYGTSVISIQFDRSESHSLSIKNRYNHTVANPDATFSNDLDNIIPGLTKSFEKENGFVSKKNAEFSLRNYLLLNNKFHRVKGQKSKIVKKEITEDIYGQINTYIYTNQYYCLSNNKIYRLNTVDGTSSIEEYDKNQFIVFDNYILDLKNKKFILPDSEINDSFIDNVGEIEKISITNKKDKKEIEILPKEGLPIILNLDKEDHIIEVEDNNSKILDMNYFRDCQFIKKLSAPNVEIVKDGLFDTFATNIFLSHLGDNLEYLNLPKAKKIGNYFCRGCRHLKTLNINSAEEIGADGLYGYELETLKIDNLKFLGKDTFFGIENKEIVSRLKKIRKKAIWFYLKSLLRFKKHQEEEIIDEKANHSIH